MEKNPHAVALGRLGGKVKGIKGANMLPPEQRSANARKAALARHAKKSAEESQFAIDNANRLAHK